MAADTVTVTLNDNAWTAMKTTQTEVSLSSEDGEELAVHVGTSLPGAAETNFATFDDYYTFSGLAATDIVYCRALHGTARVTAIRA